ncbi:general stress protein [Candidatus Cyanaurora vandensis]|uniref:general stress protein n=1 Tax=Candidatus Cyanaurora vandensis TaxID=2714958 RepID=UPI00257D2F71|nr:general stress protein [Candidatus Cyanaurora vandensis]
MVMSSPLAGSTIAGLFQDVAQAQAAVMALQDLGIAPDQISIALGDRTEQSDLMDETGSEPLVRQGLTNGGLGAGWIEGLARLLGGERALAGYLFSTLVGKGIPERQARHFETGFLAGEVVVAVMSGTHPAQILDILERHGADTGRQLNYNEDTPVVATQALSPEPLKENNNRFP